MFEFGDFGIKRPYRPWLRTAAIWCGLVALLDWRTGLRFICSFFSLFIHIISPVHLFDLSMDVRRFSLRKSELIPMSQSSEVQLRVQR